jgi:DNA polymerase-3 subunit delta'
MNRYSANSLLKTLEEPPPYSLILLVTARPGLLPATILSRCHQIVFRSPRRDTALTWLKQQAPDVNAVLALACGEPLTALALHRGGLLDAYQAVFKELMGLISGADSAVTAASRCQQCTSDVLLSWVLSWLTDIAKIQCVKTFDGLNNPDVGNELRVLADRIDPESLFSLYESMLRLRGLQHTSLNRQLMLEDIFLAWRRTFGHIQ